MKRILLFLLAVMCAFSFSAQCEETGTWADAPVITKAYEQSPGQLYIEWNAKAVYYLVCLDGTCVATVPVTNTVIPIKEGTHSLIVYPCEQEKKADTNIEVDVSIVNLKFDLAAVGLDPKTLRAGIPSASINFSYNIDPIFNAIPENIEFQTDSENRVLLSFQDPYNADEYYVTIKSKKNSSYVVFKTASEEIDHLILKHGSNVTLILDQAYLQEQDCIIPKLNDSFTFAVQFRKYAENKVNKEKLSSIMHESKKSDQKKYTPIAIWKNAPQITSATQTADGQITLQWIHANSIDGCEYEIKRINRTLSIITKEEDVGKTFDNEYTINDLLDGNYTYKVIPTYNGEKGNPSEEVTIHVENAWVIAPVIEHEQIDSSHVKLSWKTTEGIESYHIVAYVGDSKSLLKYVNKDYKKYAEYDIPAAEENMEYIFEYEGDGDQQEGLKLKFEVYGVRRAEDGKEQRSATTIEMVETTEE